jgi:hypothetical protein
MADAKTIEEEVPPMKSEVVKSMRNMETGECCTCLVCQWCNTIGGHQDYCWERQVACLLARQSGRLTHG